LKLGRELAAHGTLAALLPLQEQKEVAELIAENKQLSPVEQAKLRATADHVFASMRDRLFDATGRSYAEQLSIGDLQQLVRFYRTPAAVHYQTALPAAIASTMATIGHLDFKGDVLAAYCKETGKLCRK
jgi:hypothetical protein